MKEKIAILIFGVTCVVFIVLSTGQYIDAQELRASVAALESTLGKERAAAAEAAAAAVKSFNASQAEWVKKLEGVSAEHQAQVAKLEIEKERLESQRSALNDYLVEVQPIVDAHNAARQKVEAQKKAAGKPKPTTVLTYTGDGIRTSHTFDVRGTWRIRWDLSFSEADYGFQPLFIAHVEPANGDALDGPRASAQTSRIGFGESYGSGSGPARLEVNSTFCHWTVYVEILD